jgi:hypothetical protein
MAHVCYATTDDGVALPVVDITNPAFVCEFSDEALDAIAERTRRGLERSRRLPVFVLRLRIHAVHAGGMKRTAGNGQYEVISDHPA